MQLTLQQLFGEGSYQDAEKVVINKTSLPLTPSINNSAQSLFVALLEKARFNYHGQLSANGSWLTIDGANLEFNNSNNYHELNVFYLRNQIQGNVFQSIYKVVILELMEIINLPEITTPELNDFLVIQKASNGLVGKVALRNLVGIFGSGGSGGSSDNGDNDNDNDNENPPVVIEEEDMYLGQASPSNPTPGKMWGELNSLNELTRIWIWQVNSANSDYAWMSDIKEIRFNLTNTNPVFQMILDTKVDYLFKTIDASFYSTSGDSTGSLNLRVGGNSNISNQSILNALSGNFYENSDYVNYGSIGNGFISTTETYRSDDYRDPGVNLLDTRCEINSNSISYVIHGLIRYQLVRK